MLDDHARAERLRQAPRPDLAMGERVRRFLAALQTRIVRELARLDPEARFRSEEDGRRVRLAEGAVFGDGRVDLAAGLQGEGPPGSVGVSWTTSLTVGLRGAKPGVADVALALCHTAAGADPLRPVEHWFDGEARLSAACLPAAAVAHVQGVWRRVCARHPGLAGVEVFHASAGTLPHRDEAVGLRFERLGVEDPEGAFLFVREVGRAFLPATWPPIERVLEGGG